jgi:hypothetical protein
MKNSEEENMVKQNRKVIPIILDLRAKVNPLFLTIRNSNFGVPPADESGVW